MLTQQLVTPAESFLILHVGPQRMNGVLLSVDDERVIRLQRSWPDFEWAKWSAKISHLRPFPKVVVSVHPSLIFTELVPVKLWREHIGINLDEIEFHNLLTKLVTDILASERKKAAKALGEDEVHAILVDVRARDLKIDGRPIVSPFGLPAHKIEGVFTGRELFERWGSFFRSGQRFFFTGSTSAQLSTVQKVLPSSVQLLHLDREGAVLTKPNLKQHVLAWSPQSLLRRLATRWSVDENVAQNLYHAVAQGHASPGLAQALAEEFTLECQKLLQEIKRHATVPGDILVSGEMAPPFALPYVGSDGVTLRAVPQAEILDALSFTLDAMPPLSADLFPTLASFLEFYYDKNNYFANNWLRSRVHWLSPSH